MINVEITASLSSEKNRIIATYANVLNGFFIKNGFYPLPFVDKENKIETVVLPQLDYLTLDVHSLKKLINSGFDIDYDFMLGSKDYTKVLSSLNVEELFDDNILKKEYIEEIKKYLFEAIIKYSTNFSYLKNKNFNVKVFITQYGTLGSFNGVTLNDFDKDTIDLYFYLRADMPAFYICELFISSVTYNMVHAYTNNWQNGESVSDFLTKYFMNLPGFIPTLEATENINKELLHKSIAYLHNLGISANSVLEYDSDSDKIFIRNKEITNIFSSYERLVLTHFIKNKGSIVTFDDIARVLYGKEAEVNFSLWGINKCIQRIRNKLIKEGIPKSIIKNVKGIGFVF